MAPLAAAQAQSVRLRNEVTEQESLQLTRNLLRIAMFNISYIRGLFPENYYHDKFVPALEMKVKKLQPMDMESKRFIDWMEKGVFDALQKKYLRTLFLTICRGQDGPLVEEYVFSFKYASKGSSEDITSMTIESSSGKTVRTNTNNQHTPQQMKQSACKMVRTLVQLMHTLDNIPQERTIVMKLHYYDDVTPANYEPPFFTSSTYEDPNLWAREPLKMKVGHVDSKHYKLAIKMKSVFDPCQDENELAKNETCSGLMVTSDDDSSSGSEAEEINTQPSQPSQPGSQKPLPRIENLVQAPGSKEQVEVAFEANGLAKKLKRVRATSGGDAESDSDKTQDSGYEAESLVAVRAYLQKREERSVHITDILGEFPQISKVLIEELVERLVVEEVLILLKKDLYHVKKTQSKRNEALPELIGPSQPGGHKIDAIPKGSVVIKEREDEEMAEEQDAENEKHNLYKMALLHTLPREYITMAQLQEALGDVNSGMLREFICWMSRDGFIEKSSKNRRNGRQVFHTPEAEKKLQELRALFDPEIHKNDVAFEKDNVIMSQQRSVNLRSKRSELSKPPGSSIYGCVQVLGSEVTRQEHPNQQEYSTAKDKQTNAVPTFKKSPLSQTPMDKCAEEPVLPEHSAKPNANGKRIQTPDMHSPPDVLDSPSELVSYGPSHHLKASKVDGPIYQPPFKRIRSG